MVVLRFYGFTIITLRFMVLRFYGFTVFYFNFTVYGFTFYGDGYNGRGYNGWRRDLGGGIAKEGPGRGRTLVVAGRER